MEKIDFAIEPEEWLQGQNGAVVKPHAMSANYRAALRLNVFRYVKGLFDKAQDFPIADKRVLLTLIVYEHLFGADRVALNIEDKNYL